MPRHFETRGQAHPPPERFADKKRNFDPSASRSAAGIFSAPNDIAVPTFVPKTFPGVICAYHLSMIRPKLRQR